MYGKLEQVGLMKWEDGRCEKIYIDTITHAMFKESELHLVEETQRSILAVNPQIMERSFTMEKNTLKAKLNAGNGNVKKSSLLSKIQKSNTEKVIEKVPGFSLEGFTIAKEIKQMIMDQEMKQGNAFKSLQDKLVLLESRVNALFAFGDILKSIQEDIKKLSMVSPGKQDKPEKETHATQETSNGDNDLFPVFQRHMAGKTLNSKAHEKGEKGIFEDILNRADFTSYQDLEKSVSDYWKELRYSKNVCIYAPRSKQSVIQALWETNKECNGTTERKQSTATSPVKNKAYFAKSLHVPEDEIQECMDLSQGEYIPEEHNPIITEHVKGLAGNYAKDESYQGKLTEFLNFLEGK